MPEIMIRLSRDEINDLQYPVVVEMWKHIMQNGKQRHKWFAEFPSAIERARVATWYKKFCDWYLVSGTPESVTVRPETIIWLKSRLIPFFGSL